MPDFNPDQYLAEKSATGLPNNQPVESTFDPDQYLEGKNFNNYESLQDQYGGPTGVLANLTGHAANAILPGATRLAGQDPETTKLLSQANPVSSTVGDILGFAGGVGSGIGAPAATVAAGRTMGALAPGLVGKALQFGTEGALMGATNVANDAILGDPNLTAQKALTNIGLGAALGVAGAPVAELAVKAIPAAAKKLSSALEGLQESVMGTAEEPSMFAKAIAGTATALNGKPMEANAEHLFSAMDSGQVPIKKVASYLSDILTHGDAVTEDLEDSLGKEFKRAEETIPGLGARPGTPLFEVKTPEQAESILKTKALLGDYQAARDAFEKVGGIKAIESVNVDQAAPDSLIKKDIINNFVEASKKVLNASENYANYKEAETSISKLVNEMAKKDLDVRQTLKAMTGNFTKRVVRDAVVGGAAHAVGMSNPLAGIAVGAVEAYQALSNPYEMGTALNSAFQKLRVFAQINEAMGEKMGTLSKSIFSNAAIRNTALPRLSLESLPAVASDKGYENKVKRIGELASNPDALTDHLAMHTEDLYQDLPNVSAALHGAMLSSIQFLASKVPQPKSQMLLSGKWEPSRSQKQQFMTYYRAVTDPLVALKDTKNGTLSNQTMEAIQATHPQLLQDMRRHVMENLNPEKAKRLPYPIKMSLSKFMGEPLTEGMLPPVIMSNQLSFIGPQQSQQNAPRQRRVTGKGMHSIGTAKRASTETQELEEPEV